MTVFHFLTKKNSPESDFWAKIDWKFDFFTENCQNHPFKSGRSLLKPHPFYVIFLLFHRFLGFFSSEFWLKIFFFSNFKLKKWKIGWKFIKIENFLTFSAEKTQIRHYLIRKTWKFTKNCKNEAKNNKKNQFFEDFFI